MHPQVAADAQPLSYGHAAGGARQPPKSRQVNNRMGRRGFRGRFLRGGVFWLFWGAAVYIMLDSRLHSIRVAYTKKGGLCFLCRVFPIFVCGS